MQMAMKCFLYLDVEVAGEMLGRIVIEPLQSSKTTQFASHFQTFDKFQCFPSNSNVQAVAAEAKPCDFVRFVWTDIHVCPNFLSPTSNNTNPNDCQLEYPTELTTGAVLYYSNCTESGFYILTSGWNSDGSTNVNGCLVGRIYKGMSIVNYLTSDKVEESSNDLINACKIVATGFIGPGQNPAKQFPMSLLDDFPTSPSDAVGFVDFSNLENVFLVAYCIKASASNLFQQTKYHMAMSKFKKAIQYLTYAAEKQQPIGRDKEIQMLSFIVPCILDSAVCKLKLKDFSGALEDCNEALEINPMNPKIFYRRGQAHHGKMDYEQSLGDLYTAIKLSPNDKSIKNEISAVEAEIRVYRKVDRRRNSSETSVETIT